MEARLQILPFFSLSGICRHFFRDLYRYKVDSVCTKSMSWILSVPLFHRSQMIRSPFCSESSRTCGGLLGINSLIFWVFMPHITQPVWMRCFPWTCEVVKSLMAIPDTTSCNLLGRVVTRLPFYITGCGRWRNRPHTHHSCGGGGVWGIYSIAEE